MEKKRKAYFYNPSVKIPKTTAWRLKKSFSKSSMLNSALTKRRKTYHRNPNFSVPKSTLWRWKKNAEKNVNLFEDSGMSNINGIRYKSSDACEVQSNAGETYSDAGEMDSDAGETYSDAGEMDSDAGETYSDAGEVHSDAGDSDAGEVHSDAGEVHSDAGEVHSDAGEVHSDAGEVHSDAGEVHSDAGEVHSDAGEVHSDAGEVHSDAVQHAVEAEEKRKPILGVKGTSVLSSSLNLIEGVPIDYMHAILEGISRRILSVCLDSKNHSRRYYLGRATEEIDKR